MLPSFAYLRPTTLADAVTALGQPGARIHAGGTDLLGCLRDRVFAAERLVSLSAIGELAGIARTPDGGLRLGATTTIATVAAFPEVVARYRVLAEAALAVASPQLRNQGTLGGNLCQRPRCWYFRGDFHCARKGGETCFAVEGENRYHCVLGGETCFVVHPSDTAPALVALDALVRIVGPGGSRVVPLAKFFVPPSVDFTRETVLEPGEVLTEVVVPPPPAGVRSTYRKRRTRGAWDFALAGAAVVLGVEGVRVRHARVVLSGVAPVPWRAPEAEAALLGHRLDPAAIAAAARAAVVGAEPLSDNGYKVPLLAGAVEEALTALVA